MTRITSFRTPLGTYNFPVSGQQVLSTNFRDVLARTTRLIGTDGGIDEYGTGYAPSAVGNITLNFYLVSQTLEGMQAKRDEVGQMRGWGVGQLYYQPTDPAQAQRWAFCRVNRIDDSQALKDHPDRFQLVQMSLQSSQPYFYSAGNERLWDDSGLWDDGGLWDSGPGAAAPTNIVNSGTLSVTPGGNVKTTGRVLMKNNGGAPFLNPIIQRIRDGEIVDQIKYWGSVAAGDWAEFDPRSHRAMLGISGEDIYDQCEFLNPNWMELQVGANTIQVYLSGTADVAVRYMERYV